MLTKWSHGLSLATPFRLYKSLYGVDAKLGRILVGLGGRANSYKRLSRLGLRSDLNRLKIDGIDSNFRQKSIFIRLPEKNIDSQSILKIELFTIKLIQFGMG